MAWPGHVNRAATDLVDESPATIADRNLVKSKTCCDFFCNCANQNSKPIPIRAARERKKLFPSFSHPDTSFVFTDAAAAAAAVDYTPDQSPTTLTNRRHHWRRNGQDLELEFNSVGARRSVLTCGDRRRVSVNLKSPASSDRNVNLTGGAGDNDANETSGRYTIIAVHPEIAVKVRTQRECQSDNELAKVSQAASSRFSQLKITKSESDAEFGQQQHSVLIAGNGNCGGSTAALPQPPAGKSENGGGNEQQVLAAAQKYFEESGILGPVVAMGNAVFRKSSKVNIIDNQQFEQIRKLSRTVHRVEKPMKTVQATAAAAACDEELANLRELLKKRDCEIGRLKREIHKLKSVLQQTSEAPIETDLVSRIQTPCQPIDAQTNILTLRNTELIVPFNSKDTECAGRLANDAIFHFPGPASTITSLATKKQGVSAESSENKQHMLKDFKIEVHAKDFRSKQLIKDAILDNDFLKNLASSQIKKLVESMYRKDIPRGEYVIREGESGDHLYISDDGEFEVIKDGAILGKMGPGKAFGELAILYNCKRTASIRVLSDCKVWVLDRRVFQHIMMRTGMEKIEENINFLRSVPLLKHLGVDSLAKIADVLELEFYPTGTYIIRQDTSGDSFFLISQGNVKVTQRIPGTTIEEEIRVLQKGDYFGEQALIKEDKRTANIIALSPGVECLTLDRDSFRKFIGDLSELHEIDYGDANRASAFKDHEQELMILSNRRNQQLSHIGLGDLEVVTTLGVGGFGRVELVKYCSGLAKRCDEEESNDLQTYALKCLKKQHIVETKQEEHVFNERSIMMSCESKFICRLFRTYRDSKYVYMLMEACLGGEIWTILRNRGYFDEYSGKFIVGCVLEALQYLHTRGIVYRDLKPENLLLDANGYVKLVDFGFAKYIGFSSKTWTFCGTPEYVCPEIILNKGHDRAVDYWALGILVYELLAGTPPFTSPDPMKTYNIILKNMMEFPGHISKTAVIFIKKLCRDVPAERLGYQRGGVQEVKKHKWFQGFDWDGLIAQTLPSPIGTSVKSAIDTSNFDCFPIDIDVPPDEFSGWDADF